jgi:TonB-dependent starch-binding outer membrane protein SusC
MTKVFHFQESRIRFFCYKQRVYVFLILLIGFSFSLFAQTGIVLKGKIVDEKNSPLIGATVTVKGTATGSATDTHGNFKFAAKQSLPITLEVRAIGYKNQEIDVYENAPVEIILNGLSNQLDEVIVTGYSTQTKKYISGAVTTVNTNALKDNTAASSFNELLQGKATGVQVTSNSGVPGGSVTFRIRGTNSVNAGVDPLYIIDGVFISSDNLIKTGLGNQAQSNPLADINPDDIENVTILKDANATAIYGSLGANGVVIVTTKRGKKNSKAKINLQVSHGWSKAAKTYPVANGVETAELANESAKNTISDGGTASLVTTRLDTIKTYDRLKDVFRTAATSDYNLSVQGGNDKNTYFVSLGYLDQQSIVKPSAFKRYSGRLNYDTQITDKLKLGTSYNLSRTWRNVSSNDNNPVGVINSALFVRTYLPVYNSDGSYARYGAFDNHIALINNLNNDAVGLRSIGNIFADYAITPDLKLRSSWSIDNNDVYENNYSNTWISAGIATNGSASSYDTKNQILTNEQILTFIKSFGKNGKHYVNALIGNTINSSLYQSTSATGTGFATNDLTAISTAATTTGSSSKSESKLASFFSKASYTYDNKYTIDGSIRADGSSKFGSNKRWGYFPSGGVTWNASQEQFIHKLNVFDELKLRGSIGLSGNQSGIGAYASQGLWSGSGSYLSTAGTAPSQLANPNLTWETTRQIDLGTEFSVLKNRLSVSLDYYNKYTYDLLLAVPVTYSSGFASYTQNYGAVSNKGFEVSFHSINIQTKDFSWTSDFNISHNKNLIKKLASDITQGASGRNISILKEGYSVNSFYLYKQLYVDTKTGNAVYEDVNKDGKITSADRQVVGNANPDFTGGFTNTITYKNFELNLFISFVHGNKIMNMNEFFMVHGGTQKNIGFLQRQLERWQKVGDVTDIPRLTTYSGDTNVNGGSANNYGGVVSNLSSRYLDDGSFVRLKSASLTYNIPSSITRKVGISNAKIYLSGTNLITLTKYRGLDPEVSSQSSNQNTSGYDWATAPQPRTITTGINVTF